MLLQDDNWVSHLWEGHTDYDHTTRCVIGKVYAFTYLASADPHEEGTPIIKRVFIYGVDKPCIL